MNLFTMGVLFVGAAIITFSTIKLLRNLFNKWALAVGIISLIIQIIALFVIGVFIMVAGYVAGGGGLGH